jgi:hypothetical protein
MQGYLDFSLNYALARLSHDSHDPILTSETLESLWMCRRRSLPHGTIPIFYQGTRYAMPLKMILPEAGGHQDTWGTRRGHTGGTPAHRGSDETINHQS